MEPKQSGTDGTQHATQRMGGGWIFPAFLAIALLILFVVARRAREIVPQQRTDLAAAWTPSQPPVGETVSLTIDFGNGTKKEFAALPWRAEMTVADLLEAGRSFRPEIEFAQIGSGAGGYLSSIDGLANGGASGRNWIYQVDGQPAHVSFCLEKLEPGMHVLWTFTDELYNEEAAEK